jgi:hypothetical protein
MSWKCRSGSPEWWAKWTRRDDATGCLLYAGRARLNDGHVQITYNARPVLLHRLAYEQAYGPIPEGMKVCHTCDVRHCAEPTHMFLGTQKDNLRDMFAKGRARPRGKTTAPLASFPAETYTARCRVRGSGTRKNSNTVREVVDLLHLTRTSADLAGDSNTLSCNSGDSDTTTSRPSQARETWVRPDLRTQTARNANDVAAD